MTKGYVREKMREITADRSALRKCRNAVSAGVLSPISSAVGRNGAVGDKRNACAGARLHLIRHGFAVPPVSLRVGRFADLTRHRRVIQHREPLEGKANEDVSFDDISLVNGWYADLLCRHLDIPVAFRDTFW